MNFIEPLCTGGWWLAGIEIISEYIAIATFQRFDLKKYQHKYQQIFALPHIEAFARDFNSVNLP
ncbi:hypothetical protein [Comamonas aquatica]|uniref:hypothetical protein n=1 Tax=Comamonas aquatica TaxID=225991 RepID=UPI00244C7527|nr:hypothetical protein [Comamonas aquatica]MDH1675812.1 hypothetical protein [Comamonas aquatica]MDH1679482.1 hypothetical protein [Comamonas aquatica]